MTNFHQSVLLKEAIDLLRVSENKLYIDATVGAGGHTFEILTRGGKVLGIDRDLEAIEHIKNQFQVLLFQSKTSQDHFKFKIGKDLILAESNFINISKIAKTYGFSQVSGIIFDLGVSTHQLEEARRGFSFQKEGPLDMRMDKTLNVRASDIVNNFEKRRLYEIFNKFGQEKYGWAIADSICRTRQIRPLETTSDLAKIVEQTVLKIRPILPKRLTKVKARIFQALRIVVNSELINLEEALPQTLDLLGSEGRLVVISFHSLEEKLVKRFFKHEKRLKVLTQTPIGPSKQEILHNPKSRSARLQAAVKI